jgi:HPt (histidine-containing phosphotransfer) domain-containing protein
MDGYISKPVHAEELFTMIDTQFPCAPESETAESTSANNSVPPLGWLETDADFLSELAATFLRDYRRRIATIQEAIQRRDANQLAFSAHSLKGSVANFESGPTYEAALTLELKGCNADWSDVDETYMQLETGLEKLRFVLESLLPVRE